MLQKHGEQVLATPEYRTEQSRDPAFRRRSAWEVEAQ
jgi:hypothetical protein